MMKFTGRPEVEGERGREETYENVFLSAPIILPDFCRSSKAILMNAAGYVESRDKGYPFDFLPFIPHFFFGLRGLAEKLLSQFRHCSIHYDTYSM